jgi:hypothetical protein
MSSTVIRASSSTKPRAAATAGRTRRGSTAPLLDRSSIRPQMNGGATHARRNSQRTRSPPSIQSIAAPPSTPSMTATPPMRGVGAAWILRSPPHVSSSASRLRCEARTRKHAAAHARMAAKITATATARLGKPNLHLLIDGGLTRLCCPDVRQSVRLPLSSVRAEMRRQERQAP